MGASRDSKAKPLLSSNRPVAPSLSTSIATAIRIHCLWGPGDVMKGSLPDAEHRVFFSGQPEVRRTTP